MTPDTHKSSLRRRGVALVPSLFTSFGLFLGFVAIIRSLHGDYIFACYALMGAMFCDMLDGRLARATNSESQFGKEYDSLADLASFGFAPAFLVYVWALEPFGRLGWLAAFLYFACAALRLARFNTGSHSNLGYFKGLPTPAAAMFVVALTLYHKDLIEYGGSVRLYVVFVMYALSLLMVSSFPYRSFKEVYLSQRRLFMVLVLTIICIMLFSLYPRQSLLAFASLYALSGPAISTQRYIKRLLKH